MINTVHEDDLAAWYRIPQPVGEISISDFELEDDDFVVEGVEPPSTDGYSWTQPFLAISTR